MYLKNWSNETIGRADFDAADRAEALIIATAVLDCCSDMASGCELWNTSELVFSSKNSTLPKPDANFMDYQQQKIIDTEIALRDSNWLIAGSKKLVAAIERHNSSLAPQISQGDMSATLTNPGSDFESFVSGIESPSLRAVAQHWNQARGGKLMPAWDDLSSAALAPHFKLLWGFKFDRQKGEFTGRLAGTHIREWLGANFWGAKLEDIHPPYALEDARAFLTKVVMTPGAGLCSGRLFTIGGQTVTGERMALPLAQDGVHADGVLGTSDFEYPLASGPVAVIHENIKWCPIAPQ